MNLGIPSAALVGAVTEPAELVPNSAPPSEDSSTGTLDLVAGAYGMTGVIGGGAMGVVYSAIDVQLNRPVALKLIREHLLSPGFRDLFRQEARAMALVNHPNVVTIYSFGEHAGVPYLAMEFVHGKALDRLLDEHEGPLKPERALALLDQACAGLSAIHAAGTVHRDIKPSNLLVDQQDRLRIGDLGLAASYRDGNLPSELVGTPGYIAPEIVLRSGNATPKSDVYSVACVAYELLVGRPPFRAMPGEDWNAEHVTGTIVPPSVARPGLPAAFDLVLAAGLAKDPAQRTASADLFRRALREARASALDPDRILIAEDDPDERLLLELALEAQFPFAELECVADGEAALAAFDRKPANVVVSDLQMPKSDGLALTAALRARKDADAVPILLLTASGGPEQWRLLASLGADGCILKPANIEDIASTIRRTYRQRRAASHG
jgi:serine/threonine-protein kinase